MYEAQGSKMGGIRSDLIVALDFPSVKEAREFWIPLKTEPVLWKVGLELFTSQGGRDFVAELVAAGARVFLDLKFYDIPNTVAKASVQAANLGVEMFTLHLSGGRKMVEAVRTEFAKFKNPPRILGVTVLTSFAETEFNEVQKAFSSGEIASISDSVLALAKRGQSWGARGIVCSPAELRLLNQAGLRDLYKVVPGIRPTGSDQGDQARVMTPAEAFAAGADAIVVGRPITQSRDPKSVIRGILENLL